MEWWKPEGRKSKMNTLIVLPGPLFIFLLKKENQYTELLFQSERSQLSYGLKA